MTAASDDYSPACEHDWRALREWETVEYPPAMPAGMTAVPIPQQSRTVHWIEWYCTKCRQIEAAQR